MSNALRLSVLANILDDGTSGQILTSQGSGVVAFADATGGSSVITVTNVSGASDSLTAISSPSVGDIVFVTSTNGLFIRKSNGWFKIADVTNLRPTGLTGVSNSALAIDGTPTTITLAATDPEGLTLTFSAAAKTGSNTTFSEALTDGNTVNAFNGSTVIATVAQNSNVFTIDPNTANNAGTVDITFSVTDGINTALTADGQFTLTFVTTVTNSNNTILLATATGTSDNDNITYIDGLGNTQNVTVNGDAYAGTFSPYRSGGYSLGFSGNSYITLSNSSTFELTGDFCIDGFWYLPTTNSGTIFELGQYQNGILFGPDQYDNGIYVNGTKLIGLASSVTINTWQHFAIVRKGTGSNNLKLYIDGTKVAESTVTANINSNYSSYTNIRIGSATHTYGSGSDLDDGSYIRDLRIVKGDSVYPSSSDSVPPNSITVPTEKSTAITGTILLAGALPYLADASTTDSTIIFTATNTVSTKPFSPYDYNEYSATDHGGSVYFDGTGDYLSISNQGISGDLTYEGWFYQTVAQSATWRALLSSSTYGSGLPFQVYTYNTNIEAWTSGSGGAGIITKPFKPFTWFHVAIVRSSGTWTLYVNGKPAGSNTVNGTYNFASTTGWSVGAGQTGLYPFTGYASDVKLINSAITNFTPPTSPKSSSGASLHIKGTDASIIDKSQSGNIKLIGDTTGSTTQVKFSGSKSMYFDGTGDRATVEGIQDLGDDFTIECWHYATASGNKKIISSIDNVGGFNSNGYWEFGLALGGSNYQLMIDGGTFTHTSTAALYNQWVHLAVTRTSNTVRYFINGTLDSTTFSNSLTLRNPSGVVIGSSPNNTYIYNFTGYIQDLRVSNECKYTTSFSVPTAPLEG